MLASLTEAIITLLQSWYGQVGYLGVVLAMAIESCGTPLPSELVMPLAGIALVDEASVSFWPALIGVTLAGALGCLIGSLVAYGIGRALGRPLVRNYGRYLLLSPTAVDRAERAFARFGPSVVGFARLVPGVRTYISLPAGIARMPVGTFCLYTWLGSVPWCGLLAWVGYKLGSGGLEQLSTPFRRVDLVIVFIVVVLAALSVYRQRRHHRAARVARAARQAPAQDQPEG